MSACGTGTICHTILDNFRPLFVRKGMLTLRTISCGEGVSRLLYCNTLHQIVKFVMGGLLKDSVAVDAVDFKLEVACWL